MERAAFDAEGGARRGRVEGAIKAIFDTLRERAHPPPGLPPVRGEECKCPAGGCMNGLGDDKARDPSHTELPPLNESCGQQTPLWIRSSFVRSARLGDGVEKLLFHITGFVS